MSDFKDDDITLFDEIYNKYKNIIYYLIKRNAYDKSHYDDIFQEVMMKIYKSIKNYDATKGSIKNYIRSITINCINDYYRKDKEHNVIVNSDVVNSISNIESKDLVIDLEHDLTPFEYDLFVSYYVMGMSKRAIAKDFNIKYSTCRNRLKDLEVKLNNLYNKK